MRSILLDQVKCSETNVITAGGMPLYIVSIIRIRISDVINAPNDHLDGYDVQLDMRM